MNIFGRAVSPRVGQMDATLLDAELVNLLESKFFDAFKTGWPKLKETHKPELQLLLRLGLFKLTIWDHATTYGAKLQNLKFVSARSTQRVQYSLSRKQKLLYGLVTVLGEYAWRKLELYLTAASYDSQDAEQLSRLRSLTDRLHILYVGCSLANFVSFLYSGEYATLLMRILGMRFVSVTRKVVRNVNYEFQNRQLVWNALTEFLLFVLPLVNVNKIVYKLKKLLGGGFQKRGELGFLPKKTCAICYQQDQKNTEITNPYKGECGHLYCYVCLKLKVAECDEWPCLRCGEAIKRVSCM